mmetsp:Transcript_15850/g.36528  ORF Transcript_15850/g.36528 Transcript_15850/m.36528 type:complete len:534 (-) Transcript_15850:121-1722(-)
MVDKGPLAVSTNVSKPEKHGSGRSAVVDYLVTTSFDGGSESLVRRSFEDFQWVQKRLVKERMGIIVPILSDKKPARAKDQFFEAFINFRQEIMDRFLQRVIHHPELVDAPCLLPFFTANPTDWSAAKDLSSDDKDVLIKENTTNDDDEADFGNGLDTIHIDAHAAMHSSDPKEKKGAMRRWFSEKRTKWALQNDNLVLEETPAEAKKFSDMKTYASHLEVCVRILSEDFMEMNSANAVVAEKTETMGSAFAQLWGEHELSNTSSSSLYQSLGKVWSNASKAIKNHVSFGERYFQHPVDDLVMDIVALQDALAKRKEAVYTFTKLTREGQSINKQLDKIRMGGTLVSQQDKFYKLETELRHVDNKIAESRNHSDLVTTRLERDVERFRVEWHERMRHVLEVYHKQHVEQLQSQLNDFSSVLAALATLDSERSNLTLSSPEPEKLEINMSFGSSGAKASVAVVGAPADLPSPPPTDERTAPPAADGVAVSPDVQAISLNASFSSDDGFDSAPAMGGESTVTANTDGTEKPIVTSL